MVTPVRTGSAVKSFWTATTLPSAPKCCGSLLLLPPSLAHWGAPAGATGQLPFGRSCFAPGTCSEQPRGLSPLPAQQTLIPHSWSTLRTQILEGNFALESN